MKKNMINSNSKRIIFLVAIVLVLSIGATYAWFTVKLEGKKEIKLHSGILSLDIDEGMEEGISIENAYPMTDAEGLATKSYSFTVKNDGDVASNYVVYLVDLELDDGKTRMGDNAVKYNLKKTAYNSDNTLKESEKNTLQLLSLTGENPNRIIDSGLLQPDEYNTYTLNLWMDYEAGNNQQGTVLKTQVKVEGTQILE